MCDGFCKEFIFTNFTRLRIKLHKHHWLAALIVVFYVFNCCRAKKKKTYPAISIFWVHSLFNCANFKSVNHCIHNLYQPCTCNLFFLFWSLFKSIFVIVRHHIPASSRHKCWVGGVRMMQHSMYHSNTSYKAFMPWRGWYVVSNWLRKW